MATSYTLGAHFEEFIKSLIESGRYSTASEVMRDGLRLMEEREQLRAAKMDALRKAIQIGLEVARPRISISTTSSSVAANGWQPSRMPIKIRQRQQARADLDAIWDYIAADNPDAADALVNRIGNTLRMLADNPRIGRERSELAASLRSFPVGNYIVFYLPLPDGIDVVRILNGYLDITAENME